MRLFILSIFALALAACSAKSTTTAPAGVIPEAARQPVAAGDSIADQGGQPSDTAEVAEAKPQDPNPHISGEMGASARVAEIRISPLPVVVMRGDTVLVQGRLLDASGNRVERARWAVLVPNGVEVESIKDSIPDSYLFSGLKPGTYEVPVSLPELAGDVIEWKRFTEFEVVVNDWPVARIEIDPPACGAYAGSLVDLTARAITTHGSVHQTARVIWSSSNPDVASVTPEGIASFRSPGRAELTATAEGVSNAIGIQVRPDPVRSVELKADRASVRTGDVVHLAPTVLGEGGRALDDVCITYSVAPIDGVPEGAEIFTDGTLVADLPGAYLAMATAGDRSATTIVEARPREAHRTSQLVGRGPVVQVTTSDLWVFQGNDGRDYAYTGTHAQGGGERMYAWDVTNPSAPLLTDSVVVDARVVNDVKVNADASWAIITREGASNRRNGIIVLDLADPSHPTLLAELTDSLTAGIHNVWINGDVVYAVNDGTSALHIIDMADPAQPAHIGRWEVRPGEQDKYLHDVWAEDGLAYLSYWDDGLVILDVGAGIKGGTARRPAFVSQFKYQTHQPETYGNTHTAYRYGDYVFLGDEIFGCGDCVNGPRGYIHVVDVSDIEHPRQVARYQVPEAGSHNIWVEDGLLYIAYYQGGLRVVDVSGELRGDLYRQGREVAWFPTAGTEDEAIVPNSPLAWGPQPHKGNVFVSDMNSGLWVIHLAPPQALAP